MKAYFLLIMVSFQLFGISSFAIQQNNIDSTLTQHFSQTNPQTITHLWTMRYIDSLRILDLNAQLQQSKNTIDDISNKNDTISKKNIELQVENKILFKENRILKEAFYGNISNVYYFDFNNIFFADSISDSIRITDKIDTLYLYEIFTDLLDEKKKQTKKKKRYIKIEPDTLQSSYYWENTFSVILAEQCTSNCQSFIWYDENVSTTPYLSEHPDIEIITSTSISETQWIITYVTKHWDQRFNVEMRLAGYKIEGSKVDIVVEENNQNYFIKIGSWIIWLLTRSEIIFIIILTFLGNINKIIAEVKPMKKNLLSLVRKKSQSHTQD